MLYDVRLRIDYGYATPADGGRTLLRIMPPTLTGAQELLAASVSIDPAPDERRERTDFFGNAVTEIAFRQPLDHLRLTLRARLRRRAEPDRLDLSPPVAGLAAEIAGTGLEPLSPRHFLGASDRVRPTREMTDWARAQVRDDMSALEALVALSSALNAEMRFDPGATDAGTRPEDAFAARHGVCQDFSHVLIACLRGLGMPAGYVSGLLRTEPPPGQPRLEGADAMHAWVMAWCGTELGWVGHDPTNACFAGTDHLVIARGRDYADIAPVRGWLRIAGAQSSGQAVDVLPVGA
jgi:transglutaminase-like putative cysteine protease